MSNDTPATPSIPAQGGIKKKNLVIIGLVFAGYWALAIASESMIFIGISAVITVIALGFGFWVWRTLRKQRDLIGVLQGASASPEARQKALAKLEAKKGKKGKNDMANTIARAQLLASDDPNQAMEILEPIDLKTVPASMQDDFALLKAQLLLGFGKPKQARPLVDTINIDNPQRKEIRPFMVAIVSETLARTGGAKKANELLDTVEGSSVSDANIATLLLSARVFAQFGAGKKGLTRKALSELAAVDPNLLGRFIAGKGQSNPGLKRLAREAFERSASRSHTRGQQKQMMGGGRRGRR